MRWPVAPEGYASYEEWLEQELDQFSAQHPGLRIEHRLLSWQNARSELEKAAAEGTWPDVMSVPSSLLPPNRPQPAWIELQPGASGVAPWAEQVLSRAQGSDLQRGGRLAGWPRWSAATAWAANPELLRRAGLTPESLRAGWTWEQFNAAAQRLSRQQALGQSLYLLAPLPRRGASPLPPNPQEQGMELFVQERAALLAPAGPWIHPWLHARRAANLGGPRQVVLVPPPNGSVQMEWTWFTVYPRLKERRGLRRAALDLSAALARHLAEASDAVALPLSLIPTDPQAFVRWNSQTQVPEDELRFLTQSGS